MRISDWSSDVCSSDLPSAGEMRLRPREAAVLRHPHLVLADIAGEDRPVPGRLGELFQQGGHINAVSGRVIGHGPHPLLLGALLPPGLGVLRHGGQTVQYLADITGDADLRPPQLSDPGRVAVNVDHPGALAEGLELAARAILDQTE